MFLAQTSSLQEGSLGNNVLEEMTAQNLAPIAFLLPVANSEMTIGLLAARRELLACAN